MNTLRILIADDHPFFRLGLSARLAVEPDMEVVGEAETPEQAILLATTLMPDIVLMDVDFKADINGIEATYRIREACPQTKVLIITYMENDSVFAAITAGALGYFLKSSTPEATINAIRSVSRGEAIYSPAIAQRLIDVIKNPRPAQPYIFPELTQREYEVLVLIARGLRNPEIAEELHIEENTVRTKVSEIYRKMHVANRKEAIIRARERGVS